MKLEGLDHPKTLDFAARLQVELPTAIGHLELLWAFTGKKAPQGNVGKWPDGAIARACYWMGRPEVFVDALQQSGLIDADSVHRLTVHDWHEHAPGWVRAKLKKIGVPFIVGNRPPGPGTSDRTSEPTSEGSSDDPGEILEGSSEGTEVDFSGDSSPPESVLGSLLSKGSTSQGKGSEGKTQRRAAAPPFDPGSVPGLDIGAWNAWVQYRADRKPPIKPFSMQAAAEELATFGAEQATVVRHSKANGYQGLVPPKANGHARPTPPEPRRPTLFPKS